MSNVFDFITLTPAFVEPFNNQFGATGEQELINVFRFVDQFDQGISPAVHWATRLSPASTVAELDEVEEILIDGFFKPTGSWNEVVAFGEAFLGGSWLSFRARLTVGPDQFPQLFIPDDTSFPAFTWQQMREATRIGIVRAMVIGSPLGNSERIALDFDRDGIRNGADTNPWNPDTDMNGYPDGYDPTADMTPPELDAPAELSFVTARLAKYHVKFDEDVTYRVTYQAPGGR